MKITLRLVVSLVLVVGLVAAGFAFYQVREERLRLTSDLERRSIILAESIQESVIPLVTSDSPEKLNLLVQRFGKRERFQGIAVHDARGQVLASTDDLEAQIPGSVPQVARVLAGGHPAASFSYTAKGRIYLYTSPLLLEEIPVGVLTLFHDASYIDVRLAEIWSHNLIRFLILAVLVVAITLIVVRWSITGPIAQLAGWIKELRTGKTETVQPAVLPKMDPALDPLISEVSRMAKSLTVARAKAEKASSLLNTRAESPWTADRLKNHMRAELGGKKLYLVSNREPYLHEKDGPGIRCIVPAGGLVTALDPVMRVCDGLWIAHGSGDADRETVDENNKLRVPPGEPAYTLKRVWLTKEEEDGYYYGFANEGLWPLCHITHTRPEFRLEDWAHYRKVNEKFADALLEEITGEESPLVLVQDYHLALLPSLIKEKRPDAKVAIFWHIPWPNPEAYGICPWRQEILQGMLGSDIIGFHIQFHCNNFLETVDRFLESKIDWEHFSVTRGGRTTLIRPFPISVSSDTPRGEDLPENFPSKKELLHRIGVQAEYLGVGVDRIDYTKGIPERFRAIERFFEKYPEYVGRFTFVELGAPSRTHIKKYRDLVAEIDEAVEKIDWRFRTKTWAPIVFLKAHHTHEAIEPWYKASDLCMVTSLHDGMNLVAKEFVVSRDDGDGVLVLSQFTGASRELKDALIVNPYDIEQMADAICTSLRMPAAERTDRMGRMRANVREYNIYRWAGKLIGELARLRLTDEPQKLAGSP